jgi:U3 small nucleolar RNA-associated protein 7
MGSEKERSSRPSKGGGKKQHQSPSSSSSAAGAAVVVDKNTEKYIRDEDLNYKVGRKVKHKNLRKTLTETHDRIVDAASRTATTEVLLSEDMGFIETEHEGEKTFALKQKDIRGLVDMNTAKNIMDLKLPDFGPYCTSFSRNGRSLLLAGERGHVAMMDCQKTVLKMENQYRDTVYDVTFLHNENLWAASQSKYTYIYDDKGIEIHCLKGLERTYKLNFLPYHFLLTAVGHSGWIKWQDVSIGEYVAGFQTGHGPARVLKHNPANAVSHVGHANGVVSLWSPASGKALVSMFCHKAPVLDVAVDRSGRFMATAGSDSLVKIWDLRTYKCFNSFKTDRPAVSLDISDTGLLAMGMGREVQIVKDAFVAPSSSSSSSSTYLKHSLTAQGAKIAGGGAATAHQRGLASSMKVRGVRFRPYEDTLCMGHSHGVTSIVVPGAGEANFDTMEANPFINTKQSRETEVQSLLNKLSYQMINLEANFIGGVDKNQMAVKEEHKAIFNKANSDADGKSKVKDRKKARGRNKISAKLRRKQKNVVDANSAKLKDKLVQQKSGDRAGSDGTNNSSSGNNPQQQSSNGGALGRFSRAKGREM